MAINKYCHPKRAEECESKGKCPIIDEIDTIALCHLIHEHGLGTDEFEKAVLEEEDWEADPEAILEALNICAHVREEATKYFSNASMACRFSFDGSDRRPDPDDIAAMPMAKNIDGEGKKTIH